MIAALQPNSLAGVQRLIFANIFLLLLVVATSAGVAWVLIRRSIRLRVEAARMAAMGTATARILHQIKNPLQTILLHAEMLDDDRLVEDAEVRHEVCQAIVGEATRVTDLLAELSSYASGVARQAHREPLELTGLIRATVAPVQREVEQAGARLVETEMAEVVVEADPYFLRQALDNVLRNAREALLEVDPPRERRIEVGVRRRGGEALVTVRDTGPGIDPARLPELLEPFVTTKSQGMGLGLPICREIVETHGGRLELHARPGAGMTVTLALPLSRQRSEALQPA